MEKYKTKWNESCDKIIIFFNKRNNYFRTENQKTKIIIEKMRNFFSNNIPNIYRFISMCNYGNTPIIYFRKKEYKFDYHKRRYIVYATSFIHSVIREKHFTPLYLLLSGLFCRENLNLHFYKFTLEKDTIKPNIPLLKDNKSLLNNNHLNTKI